MNKTFLKIILSLTLFNAAAYALAGENYNFLISNKSGNIISNEAYSKDTIFLPAYNPDNLIIKKYVNRKEQSKIIDSNGKYLFNNAYEYVIPLSSNLYLAEKNKAKFILKENGTRALTPSSSSMVEAINKNAFCVKDFGSKSSGSGSIKDNFMAKHKSVIYNNGMQKIYSGDVTYTQNIEPGYIFVKIDDSNGKIIDSRGNTVISGVKFCENYKTGVIYAKTDLKEGIYDVLKRNWVYNQTIKGVPEIGSNYAILPEVKQGETFRILTDKNLKPFKPGKLYYYIIPNNDVFLASTDGMHTNKVLNSKSKEIYSAKTGENIESASSKAAVVLKNNKYSLKSIKGKEILPAKYDNIYIDKNSILAQNGSNFEVLNSKFKTTDKFTADSATLREDTIFTCSNNDCKLINASDGKVNFTAENMEEYPVKNSAGKTEYLYIASKDGKKGVVNSKNSVVIQFEYDDIKPLKYRTFDSEEFAFTVKKGNKYAVKNLKTKTSSDFIYSHQPVQVFDNFAVLKSDK